MISRLITSSLRYIFIILLLPVPSVLAEGLDERFQIDFTSEIPLAGTLAIDDDPLFGIELKYFLLHSNPHHLFLSGGYLTDEDKAGGSVEIFSLDIGAQYDLATLWGKRTYLEYEIGVTYTTEEYAFELIDREVTSSFDEFGFKGSLGYGLEFNENVGTTLSLSQYGSDSTSIGLNFFYSF